MNPSFLKELDGLLDQALRVKEDKQHSTVQLENSWIIKQLDYLIDNFREEEKETNTCIICNKRFKSKTAVKKHFEKHENQFCCTYKYCTLKFKSSYYLKKHETDAHHWNNSEENS